MIGFALFGSVTFIPVYLQLVKGYSATGSGLLLTPMMLGVLVTSTASGFLDYRFLGVATSGATLFRQVGGSIGVAVFGAIFANRLGLELAHRLRPGRESRPTQPPPRSSSFLPRSTPATLQPWPPRSTPSSRRRPP